MEELSEELRRALERDEFVVRYQPKVDLRTGRISGVEALLRWRRPGYGLVAPAEFVPVLEDTGLIGRAVDPCEREVDDVLREVVVPARDEDLRAREEKVVPGPRRARVPRDVRRPAPDAGQIGRAHV